MKRLLAVLFISTSLTACDQLPEWIGGTKEDEPKLQGDRVSILSSEEGPAADDSLATTEVNLPEAQTIDAWAQEGMSATSMGANIAYAGKFSQAERTRVGEGNISETLLMAQPVVVAGRVVAMDAFGYVSAHEAGNVEKRLWLSSTLLGPEEFDLMGGGLAADETRVFAATGGGAVAAINLADGAQIWRKSIGIPVRSAPKFDNGNLYVVTVDNQIIALDGDNGETLWTHRGINETAGYLSAVSPAVAGGVVVAPYSSGELVGLSQDTGEERWTDSLVLARRTVASSIFSGIDANPVIAGGVVYAIGSGGLFAATELVSGRRIWEQPMTGHNTPWLTGEYIYIVTSDNQLVSVAASDGRIKWVVPLQTQQEKEDQGTDRPVFSGPVMVNSNLLVAGSNGQMLAIDPKTGKRTGVIDIPDGVYTPPVIAGNILYLVDNGATLHALK